MKAHPEKLIAQIRKDRSLGFTVPALAQKYCISKSTIWRHTHTVQLSLDIKQYIQSRRGGSTSRKETNVQRAIADARALFAKCSTTHIGPVVLASLYWAEGTKSSFVFTNTDGDMMRLFLGILRKDFKLSTERFQIMIRLGTHQHKKTALKYWSDVTGVPVRDLRVNINQKYNRTTTKYGLCRVTISKGAQLLKLVRALRQELTQALK